MPDGRFEIWFASDAEVSVLVETPFDGRARDLAELDFYVAFAARHAMTSLHDPDSRNVWAQLSHLDHQWTGDDVPTSVGGTRIVPPTPVSGGRGFVGTFRTALGSPVLDLEARGFGVFGRGRSAHLEVALLALLWHLLGRGEDDLRILVIEATWTIGSLVTSGEIEGMSEADVARTAAAGARRSLESAVSFERRSDDPDEDYALLLAQTQAWLGTVAAAFSADGESVPRWLAARCCREAVYLHHRVEGSRMEEARERRLHAAEGPDSEYDRLLEACLAENGLSEIEARLLSDCLSE